MILLSRAYYYTVYKVVAKMLFRSIIQLLKAQPYQWKRLDPTQLKAASMSRAIMSSENATRALWRAADAVCFDVDSTVCMDEAIDELAMFAGREEQVALITQKAMRGGMTFRDALAKRLDMIQPTMDMMEEYLQTHAPRLTPGIRDLIAMLHQRGVEVYLVSGGFDTIIEPVAKELHIPLKNVYANRIKYYFNGEYAGFDENAHTSHQDGKAHVVSYLKKKFGYQTLIMVGDGVTDLKACPPADAFIGFGGNEVREKVKQEATWYAMSFHELSQELSKN